jgi:uncharacterized protein YaeQ
VTLKVARHPSESDDFLIARVLAYCVEYQPGIEFSRGLCDADDPPLAIRDLTGTMLAWIDIGTPSAERLHRASKRTPRVVVYVHKEHTQWLAGLASAKIHRVEDIEVRVLDRALVTRLVSRLDRRMSFALAFHDGELFASFDDATIAGRITRQPLNWVK